MHGFERDVVRDVCVCVCAMYYERDVMLHNHIYVDICYSFIYL